MKKKTVSFRSNARLARHLWGALSGVASRALKELTTRYCLSIAAGDLQLLDGRWYVTHSGLLQLAFRRGCCGIKTSLQDQSSDLTAGRWVFKATFISQSCPRASSATAMPILQMSLRWFEALSCASPRHAPSIAPSARLTGSAYAPSKSWARFPLRRNLPRFRCHRTDILPLMALATGNLGCAINSAF